jgi:DNA-binding NarL/FixJ family response regulator
MNLLPERELWCTVPPPAMAPGLTLRLVTNLPLALAQAPALPWGALLAAPNLAALGLAASLRLLAPAVRVLLTLPPEPGLCQTASELEVAALLSAAHLAQELAPCLENLDQGRRFLSKHLPLASSVAHPPAGLATLSPRELEVLAWVAQGLGASQIADRAHVSVCTVRNHKSNLVAKLGLAGRKQLYYFAGQHRAAIAVWLETG